MPRFDPETNAQNKRLTYGKANVCADSYHDVVAALDKIHKRCLAVMEMATKRNQDDMRLYAANEIDLVEYLLCRCDDWYMRETGRSAKHAGEDD